VTNQSEVTITSGTRTFPGSRKRTMLFFSMMFDHRGSLHCIHGAIPPLLWPTLSLRCCRSFTHSRFG
jgi:hypothetical protein